MDASTSAMNEATQKMAWYTLASTIFVLIGTICLVVTLYLTRQANKAAQEAVEVTREIGQIQVRAYLQLELIGINYISGKDGKAGISLNINISNIGQSPARNIIAGGLFSKSDPTPIESHISRVTFFPIRDYAAPSNVMSNVSLTVPFCEHNIIEDETGELWYALILKYEDEFGCSQLATFKGFFANENGSAVPICDIKSAIINGSLLNSYK